MRQAAVRERPHLLRRPVPTRRRQPAWKVAWVLLTSATKAALLVGSPLALAGWMFLSPYFLVDEIRVEGGRRVAAPWVEANLSTLTGEHLMRVSLADIGSRLGDHPWVDAVELRKELPRRLVVRVVEREPVALLEVEGGVAYLDGEGRPIAPCDEATIEPGLPRVAWHGPLPVPVDDGAALLAELGSLRPDWVEGLQRIELLADGDARLETEAVGFSVVLRGGELAEALWRLDRALEEIEGNDVVVREVDLRFARRVVLRPGAEAQVATAERETTEG